MSSPWTLLSLWTLAITNVDVLVWTACSSPKVQFFKKINYCHYLMPFSLHCCKDNLTIAIGQESRIIICYILLRIHYTNPLL
jgi:hypothetical protein